MTYREAYDLGVRLLSEQGIAEAGLDVRLLLEYVCHTRQSDLYAHGEFVLDALQCETYVNYINKRSEHVPLQYLLHSQEFMGLEFYVNENVLVPRQDTEILVEEVMQGGYDGAAILDLCTGSGCILLSLLHYSNGCTGVGTDISDEALAVAKRNAQSLGFVLQERTAKDGAVCTEDEAAETVVFCQGDLYAALASHAPKFDIIVSNPPYIRTDEIETLMPEVRDHEPRTALDGGGDGLTFYRRIIGKAHLYARREHSLFLEIGADQGEAVSALMRGAGYRDIRVVKDYAGLDRVVRGVRIG